VVATFIELAIAVFLVIGGVFVFIGSLGLAKLPDTMRRLHGPTKATTLGIGALLAASILHFLVMQNAGGIHEVLITMFLFLTAPVSGNLIAKAYIFRHRDIQESLPPAGDRTGWATLVEQKPAERAHGQPR
jgi:multicomponent K+:H+ antiporter subunit G